MQRAAGSLGGMETRIRYLILGGRRLLEAVPLLLLGAVLGRVWKHGCRRISRRFIEQSASGQQLLVSPAVDLSLRYDRVSREDAEDWHH